MTDEVKTQNEQALRARAAEVRARLEQLTADRRVVDEEIDRLAPQREQHELLGQACHALERLGALGAASLFWGDRIDPARATERLHEVRTRVSAFQAQLREIDDRRQTIAAGMREEEEALEILGEDLYDLREAEERRKLEWVVERDISPLPRRVQTMAWARNGEDDWRFRKALAAAMAICLLLGALVPMIDLPLPKRFQPDDGLSKRLAQLVRESQAIPLPPPPPVEQPREQTPPEQEIPDPVTEPRPERSVPVEAPAIAAAEAPAAPGPEAPAVAAPGPPRPNVQQAGILAFRDQFASRAADRAAPRLGADARLSDGDDVSQGQMPSRSMLTTNAPGSSGGINLASLSRDVGGGGGGGGGGGMQGVEVGRATSAIATIAGGGDDRPRAHGGAGSGRTDEEIQIVFDRYKSAFYRLYNRELRNDPTLQGQMVLRLTIEPDGSVSMCVLQSSDMNAPDLAAQVVGRVRTINFGAKEVPAVTIVYPIDFLPAT